MPPPPSCSDSLLAPFPVPPRFAGQVEFAWHGAPSVQDSHEILPDGCVDVVAVLQDDSVRIDVYGSVTRATTIPVEPHAHYVGFRFRPGRWDHPQLAPAALLDGVLPLREAFPASDANSVEQWLQAQLSRELGTVLVDSPRDVLVDAAVARLRACNGDLRIERLARECHVTRRTLERRFARRVGMPPKRFAEIEQMRGVLARLAASSDLGALALDCGYTDHSHMTREVRRLSGRTPSAWRRD